MMSPFTRGLASREVRAASSSCLRVQLCVIHCVHCVTVARGTRIAESLFPKSGFWTCLPELQVQAVYRLLVQAQNGIAFLDRHIHIRHLCVYHFCSKVSRSS